MVGGRDRYNLPGIGPFLITKEIAEEYIKIHTESDLKLTLRVELSSEKGISEQRIEEIKAALRELGMDDNICLSERNRPDDA